MRDDYAISADLCEEHGLVEPARVLRQVAENACEAFMVRMDEMCTQPDESSENSVAGIAHPKRLFVTRGAAERHSASLKAAFLHKKLYAAWEHNYLFTVPKAEFCRRVGAILGMDYHLPEGASAPLIPSGATEEQLAAIAQMLQPGYFEVICVSIDPGRLDR